MDERWLPVVGYEGLYEVSDLGRVRGVDRIVPRKNGTLRVAGRLLKQHENIWSGSPGSVRAVQVNLTAGNKTRMVSVGPLVLAAFVGPCPDGMECCHGDGNNHNNALGNLRWDTHLENMRDVARYGGSVAPKNPNRGERHPKALLTEDDVRCIRAEPVFYGVNRMLADAFGVGYHTVWKIRSGDNWSHI